MYIGYTSSMKDVHSVLKMWPDFDVIAEDCAISKDAVWQWVKRRRVPSKQNPNLIASAKKHKIKGISYETLVPLNKQGN